MKIEKVMNNISFKGPMGPARPVFKGAWHPGMGLSRGRIVLSGGSKACVPTQQTGTPNTLNYFA